MTIDEFATALSRLVAQGLDAGLSVEQLVDVLDCHIDGISAFEGRPELVTEAEAPPLTVVPEAPEPAPELRVAPRI